MMSCIVGALLCGAHSANMVIAGPVPHANPNNASWNYAVVNQPIQYVPPRPIIQYAQRAAPPVRYVIARSNLKT